MAVQVEGLRPLLRDLERLGVEISDLKATFKAIATKGADLAKSFTPVRTGALRASIRPSNRKNAAYVIAGDRRHPYARVNNYGWPARGYKASHFLQKADAVVGPQATKDLETAIQRWITQLGL